MRERALALTILVAGLLIFSGCGFLAPIFGPVYQTSDSHVDQGKDQGYIRFTNSTSEHSIYVDGQLVGSGDRFGPEQVLGVAPGTHVVEVLQEGSPILTRKVFIGTGSTQTIDIQ